MFDNATPAAPRPPAYPSPSAPITGGGSKMPGWFGRLSALRKVLLLAGTIVAVVIIGLGIMFIFGGSKPATPKPTQETPSSSSNNDTNSNQNATSNPPADTSTSQPPVAPTPAPVSQHHSTGTTSNGSSGGGSSNNTGGGTGGNTGGGGTTPPPPVSCDLPFYPTASCTGVPAGTNLTVVASDLHITTPGQVVDGKDVQGCVFVEAPNVTIRNSRITCGFAFAVHALASDYTGGGLVIQDTEITCNETTATGVAGYGFTATRLNVHGCENGFSIDNDATVQDSYIHDLFHDVGSHTDGIQLSGGANVTISHNKIFNQDTNGTSAIISNDTGLVNTLVTNNLLAGGGHTLYCPSVSSTNFRVIDNHFSREFYPNSGAFSAMVYCEFVTQATGNVWDDTGLPVPF